MKYLVCGFFLSHASQAYRYRSVRYAVGVPCVELLSKMLDLQGNIQVYCRVRPISVDEMQKGLKSVVESLSETELGCFDSRSNKWKSFAFDRVWGPDQSQQSVFQDVEPLALAQTDEACLVDGGVGGIEGAENFLRAVIDDVLEGAVLRANATLIPSLEETTVAISYLYEPFFDGNIFSTLDGFALYRLDQPEEQITVLLDVGSGESEDNVAGDNLFSGVVTLLPEVGQVFGFEVVPIVNGKQDRFSSLTVTQFALIRSFQAELLAGPTSAPSTSPTVSAPTLNQIITCISVIDETSLSDTTIRNSWISFRAAYPARPFCLLQPKPNAINELRIPPEFFQDSLASYASVNRDQGNAALTSDWFEICKLDELKSQGVRSVAVFIDNSGSLTTPQIRASYDLLLARMAAEGITLVASIPNSSEEWVAPFRTDF